MEGLGFSLESLRFSGRWGRWSFPCPSRGCSEVKQRGTFHPFPGRFSCVPALPIPLNLEKTGILSPLESKGRSLSHFAALIKSRGPRFITLLTKSRINKVYLVIQID